MNNSALQIRAADAAEADHIIDEIVEQILTLLKHRQGETASGWSGPGSYKTKLPHPKRILWSVAQVTEVVGLSPQGVRDAILRTDLQGIRYGRKWLVRRPDLQDWVDRIEARRQAGV